MLAIAPFLLLVVFGCGPKNELRSEREWSVLQAAEFSHRDELPGDRIVTYEYEGYHAVGIASDNSQKRVWLLLNPRSEPLIKEMPAVSYHLSKTELEDIVRSGEINSVVLEHLRQKVQ